MKSTKRNVAARGKGRGSARTGSRSRGAGRPKSSARSRRGPSARFRRWLSAGNAKTRNRKRIVTAIIGAMLAIALICSLIAAYNTFVKLHLEIAQAKATQSRLANEYGFDPGSIISDADFFDGDALSQDEVQATLDQLGAKCDGRECLRNYTETVEAIPADDMCDGYPVSKTDKDYKAVKESDAKTTGTTGSGKETGSNKATGTSSSFTEATATHTAAQIIANAARSCSISPKVLLVMLEKEQGLVSATAPTQEAYDSALGLSCPDGAACDPRYSGFFKQVYGAAERFRYYLRHPDQYGYRARHLNYVAYNPDASCGGANVWIENDATALLYIYTPYQPNDAALAAGAGEGDQCSSYGNRNFKLLYDAWFG